MFGHLINKIHFIKESTEFKHLMTNQCTLLWIMYENIKLYLVLCGESDNMVCDKGHVERMDNLHYENSHQRET